MSSELFIRNCLFCAVPCASTVITENGEIKRVRKVKRESFCGGGGDDDAELPSYALSSLPLLQEEENPLLGNQLKVFFILKNILNIDGNKLTEYLTKLEGQLHPEFWAEVCWPCGEAVGDYYQTLRLISKLKMKLATISTQLKRSIWDSKDTLFGDGGGDDFNRKNDNDDCNHKDTLNFIWRDIRDQALGRECMSDEWHIRVHLNQPSDDVKMEKQEDFIDESSNSSPRRPPSVSNSSESEDTDDEDYIPESPKKVKHRKPRSTATIKIPNTTFASHPKNSSETTQWNEHNNRNLVQMFTLRFRNLVRSQIQRTRPAPLFRFTIWHSSRLLQNLSVGPPIR
ncbi:unnamed protein product [Orchesella dallaii]|uniref:Uncharacterized protein n=1 Tax=Orchesella dallaii TaxID=48710 RepID=A0ABP1RMT6_9HEXA